jgi:cyclopropane-fatty-acyl-phospholipid synthase
LLERGMLPDALLRRGVRRLCRQRIDLLNAASRVGESSQDTLLATMDAGPIALVPEIANKQHYELPPEFFGHFLGPRRKYSCCFWEYETSSLIDAEAAALRVTCQRAGVVDGMDLLDLGCGWGSLTLWLLEHYPNCRVTAVSNSSPQREYIYAAAVNSGWADRLRLITVDMNHFRTTARFDRILSIEMFEHMRNYRRLLANIAGWLRPEGKLFVHIFCHRQQPYVFETDGRDDWMGRLFFTGGLMPSADLLQRFGDHLSVTRNWTWNGRHYGKTSAAWLERFDAQADSLLPILRSVYGREAKAWYYRWRTFLVVCAEFFALRDGREWFVSHYLLEPTERTASR